MDKQPFPFRNACFISFSKDWKQYAPLEVEEAVTDPEIYQALNYRSLLQFRKPLLLHFNKFDVQTPVWFGFSFDVEVIVVGLNGVIEKIYEMPRYREGAGVFLQFFSGYTYAILAPKGFSKAHVLESGTIKVKYTSFTRMFDKRTG
jgi:hypothetical protein